jgi:glycerol-3-phosphate dehydrogenase
MKRLSNIERLKSENFDIVVIGAGASGAAVALDATTRGLKVALIEMGDFSSQTSSKSTKLIHGGVRYLEQAFKKLDWNQYKMVEKALNERTTLIKLAPHLTRPLALLTPCKNIFEAVYYGIGMKIYDFMAGKHTIKPASIWSKAKVQRKMPELDDQGLSYAIRYYDGQLDDARYGLALVQTAECKGAAVANYVSAETFLHDSETGKLVSVQVVDKPSGEKFTINAKVFVNATGPFSDTIRLMANAAKGPRMKVSKGAHIVISKTHLAGDDAILVPKTDDGRVVFIIPWLDHVLVGTTDTEDELNVNSEASLEDITYLIDYANRYLKSPIGQSDVLASWSGQRPLIQANKDADTKSLVRDHEVEIDQKTNLVSILGGKWTTYRLMAKDTVDSVFEDILLTEVPACITDKLVLHGGLGYKPSLADELQKIHKIDAEVANRLAKKYGCMAAKVLELCKSDSTLKSRISADYPYIRAEVVYAIEHEMALSSADVSRRLGALFLDAKASAFIEAEAMLYLEEM